MAPLRPSLADPLTGSYRFDYGIFFGGLSLLLTGFVIFHLWLERRRAFRLPRREIWNEPA